MEDLHVRPHLYVRPRPPSVDMMNGNVKLNDDEN